MLTCIKVVRDPEAIPSAEIEFKPRMIMRLATGLVMNGKSEYITYSGWLRSSGPYLPGLTIGESYGIHGK
jgi:hypothetical protein